MRVAGSSFIKNIVKSRKEGEKLRKIHLLMLDEDNSQLNPEQLRLPTLCLQSNGHTSRQVGVAENLRAAHHPLLKFLSLIESCRRPMFIF